MIKKINSGFSLLEVILALMLLSTLTVLSTQALSRALKARTKIQAEVDDVSALRDSMRMIRTDLNLAYHHRDFEKEINELVKKKSAPKLGSPEYSSPRPPAPVRQTKRIEPDTHFVGTDDKMSFITMNNGRMTANLLQADFIEVGYSLKECRNLTKSDQSSKCLFRRTQSVLDDDVTAGGQEIVMLENVSEFKLRFIADGKQDWANAWDSTEKSSDAVTKGKYPEAVEVSITIKREIEKKEKTYSMQFVIPIHFPNNVEKTTTATGSSAQPGQSGNPGGGVQ
ncbi:MAG: prepilin-type N-terminal cleavage/methylation domain-containing protein [Bdellovibrio sp.]|nr:prepilin-type N-terminal cleavage/methylation domain-containing protein [Bdellovibrio sp.]